VLRKSQLRFTQYEYEIKGNNSTLLHIFL